jgi:hypothetical protein
MALSNLTRFLQHYKENAQTSSKQLNDFVQNNFNSPQGYNDIMSNYQEDPGTQYRINRIFGQNNNQNAASGMQGGGFQGYQNANAANQLISEGQQQYFNNRTQLQEQAGDFAKYLASMGIDAARFEADENYRNEILNMEKEKIAQENSLSGQFGSKLFETLGTGIGSAFGGPIGGALGGLFGGAVNKIGGKITNNPKYDYRDFENNYNYNSSNNNTSNKNTSAIGKL